VFLFDVHQVVTNKQGQPVFARIRYQGHNIIMSPHHPFSGELDYGQAPRVTGTRSPVPLYVYCNDLDQRYKLACEAGLEVLVPPSRKFWGDTLFRVIDINGYIWNFATPTHSFDPTLLPPEL
jgi:PhnB protein